MRRTILIAAAALMIGCDGGSRKEPAPEAAPAPPSAAPSPKMEKGAAPAISGPLGSKTNPVKCDYPEGERAYLSRLRGPSRAKPTFERAGSVGMGPYGHILDHYVLKCAGKSYDVFMDMYFQGYIEKNPIPGFTIVK